MSISPLKFIKYRRKHDFLRKNSQQRTLSHTQSKVASSFTSTKQKVETQNQLQTLSDDDIRQEYQQLVKSRQLKGQVVLTTNLGNMHFELFCNLAPKTTENFMELCLSSYYDSTCFHRLIPGFMIQGGDPTGTGKGGVSYYGKQFEDECSDIDRRESHK